MENEAGSRAGAAPVLAGDREVARLEQEGTEIERAAAALKVTDERGREAAVAFLARCAKALKAAEAQRKFFVDPLNAQVKAINAKFKALTAPLERADGAVREKDRAYLREREAQRQAEQRRQDEAHAAERKAARNLGMDAPPLPTAVAAAPASVRTEEGMGTAVKVWRFEVLDLKAVPWRFIRAEVNRAAVQEEIRAGAREIPGLRIFEDYDTRVRA